MTNVIYDYYMFNHYFVTKKKEIPHLLQVPNRGFPLMSYKED